MTDIVISEFMDEAAVEDLRRDFSVTYDKGLVDRPDELAGLIAGARALIVRNRTQVRGALLAAGAGLRPSAASASGSTISMSRPPRRAASPCCRRPAPTTSPSPSGP